MQEPPPHVKVKFDGQPPAEGPSLGADDPSIIVWIEIDTYLAVTRKLCQQFAEAPVTQC